MGGKNKSVTVGYWYHVAFHAGLGVGPIDAFLEFRAGDKTAWSGELTQSGTITINKPGLFGGEKDQGGIVGDVDVMFGEATQQPNAYLTATFGDQQPAWRGMSTLVFKGGKYGAMNPYPQKPSYKVRAIKMGWDGDPGDGSACWYPEKAVIDVVADTLLYDSANGWDYQILPDEANPGYDNLAVPTDGWTLNAQAPFGGGTAGGWNTYWPIHTVLWARRMVTVGAGTVQSLTGVIDNGCCMFVNGALAASFNRGNPDVNTAPISFALPATAGQTYELAIKAFDEKGSADNSGTILRVGITAPGVKAMNPAHMLYLARTASDMGREPIANMHDGSFRAAADWFYDQKFGLCTEYDPAAESVDDFISRIEKVAGCSMSRSPIDGLWYLDIANGVYDLASLPILTDDDILDFQDQPKPIDTAVNSLSVTFFDPQQKQSVTPGPVQAMALVDANGVISDTVEYPEIPTSDLALRVVQRDLRGFVTPSRTFSLTTTRKPYGWRPNTYFRLQSAKRGIADMVCILAEKSTGTLKSGAIKITSSQDVYSLPAASFVQGETGVDTRPPQIPTAIMQQTAFEAPYTTVCASLSRADLAALPGDAGYLLTAARVPGNYPNYAITVSADGGSNYTAVGTADWTPSAQIVEGDALKDAAPATHFTLAAGVLLSGVGVGSGALWGNEFCRVDAINAAATPPTLALGRGCADTPPIPHDPNSTVWFYGTAAGIDTTEYTDGESIDVELLTQSGSQQLDPSLAMPLAVDFAQRAFRPYAPSDLTINNAQYPSIVAASTPDPVPLTWVARNRIVQADQLVDCSMPGVAAEAGTTYTVRTYLDGSLVHTDAGIAALSGDTTPGGFGLVRVEIDAVRDGVASLFPLAAIFDYRGALTITTAALVVFPSGTTGTYQLEASGGIPPLAWSQSGLPAGITMDADGLLTRDGTTPDGDTAVDFTVTDSIMTAVSKPITLRVGVADPYWNKVVSLLHFDGAAGATTFVDETGRIWTAGGAAKIDDTHGKFGQCGDFTTDPAYLDTPLDPAFFPGTQDFCIEAWVRLNVLAGIQTIFSATEASGTSYGYRLAISGNLQLWCYSGTGSSWNIGASASVPNDASVHHVACSRAGGVIRYFVDGGMYIPGGAGGLNIIAPTSGFVRVGAWGNIASRGVRSWLDELRITIGAARYTAAFTPPDAPFAGG